MSNPFENDKVPRIVYKYRDWENLYHRRILENCELFLSSPKHFNDPYDCRLSVAYHLLGTDRKLANQYFNQFVSANFPDLTQEQHDAEVNRFLEDGRFMDQKWLDKVHEETINNLQNSFGVISLTEIKDNILMWSHYSNSHKGFCVGFHSKILFNNQEHFGMGGEVSYPSEYPVILPTDEHGMQMLKILYTKFDKWNYEKEYRLSKLGSVDKTITISKEAIAEVIIGYLMPEEDKKELIHLVKSNLSHVKLFHAKPNNYKYELIIEPFSI